MLAFHPLGERGDRRKSAWIGTGTGKFSSSPWIQVSVSFGTTGDTPIPANYDGDGADAVAVWRPSIGRRFLDTDLNGATNLAVSYGVSSDIPVPADYNGDGVADLAVFRPSNGRWYLDTDRNGASNLFVVYGTGSDIPLRPNGWIFHALGILP